MIVVNDFLGYKDYKIYQKNDMFCFSLDSILLANFVTLNKSIKSILDIGCGNAPIPIVLSTKTKASIIGIEIQKEVADLAEKSISCNNLNSQIKIINGDIKEEYKKMNSDCFDVIVCNPPYFKTNEKTKQNLSQYKRIARHEIQLNLDDIFKISRKLLKNNGVISIVHRTERMIEIIELMRKNNIEPKKIQFVYPKTNSDSNLVLIEGKKNGKQGIKILNPLFIHKKNGDYRKEIIKMFKG